MKIEWLDEVDSTNEYIRRYLSAGEDVTVCARRQSGGKGTKGRSFLSEEGGIYLSRLTFYRDLPASSSFRIMMNAAGAVCRTARRFGAHATVKWVNDVLVAGKKLSGTLIENILQNGNVRASIVGIGLNVNNDLSELNGIAINLEQATGKTLSVEEVCSVLIEELGKQTDYTEYCSYAEFLGQEVTVCENGQNTVARALRIAEDGRLIVSQKGQERALSAAEISLRL